jgi:hypothetical protein
LLCYANFRLCDVASHVLDMCFSWCCAYCQCPFVRIIVLSFRPPYWLIKKCMSYIDPQKNKYSVLNECNRMLKYNIFSSVALLRGSLRYWVRNIIEFWWDRMFCAPCRHPVAHVFLTLQWNSLRRASFEFHEGQRDVRLGKPVATLNHNFPGQNSVRFATLWQLGTLCMSSE